MQVEMDFSYCAIPLDRFDKDHCDLASFSLFKTLMLAPNIRSCRSVMNLESIVERESADVDDCSINCDFYVAGYETLLQIPLYPTGKVDYTICLEGNASILAPDEQVPALEQGTLPDCTHVFTTCDVTPSRPSRIRKSVTPKSDDERPRRRSTRSGSRECYSSTTENNADQSIADKSCPVKTGKGVHLQTYLLFRPLLMCFPF